MTVGPAATSASLRAMVDQVSIEDFRITDQRFERDARQGRELLFLLSNNDWARRTTEIIDVSQVRAVDVEIQVDIDLSVIQHEAFRPHEGIVSLPILTLPAERLTTFAQTGSSPAPDYPDRHHPDPVTSLEVRDAGAARVPKVPQAEVQHWLAASLAEILLRQLRAPQGPQDLSSSSAEAVRDQLVLLAAAIRRLLQTVVDAPDSVEPPVGQASTRSFDSRLPWARQGLQRAFSVDEVQRHPVMRSRVLEILDALIGTVLVVVLIERSSRTTSFSVQLPSRRLVRSVGPRWQLVPRARLRIDVITASAHTDRLFRLLLPSAVSWIPVADPVRTQVATVMVLAPLPFDQLRTLTEQLLSPDLGRVTWVDRRIARLAVDKVDSCRDSLRWYRAENSDDHSLMESLSRLRLALLSVAGFNFADTPTNNPRTELQDIWRGGSWLPTRLLRRLVENGASPDAVQVRSPVIEDFTQRSEPIDACLDLDVAVTESQVLDSARDTNAINLLLLAVVAGLLVGQPFASVKVEVLATVLTLFPAIAASRIERPDMSSLAGVLSQPGYWLSLASAVPGTLLAASMAVLPARQHPWLALTALFVQMFLQLLIVRRISGGARPGRNEGGRFTLGTEHAPDHGRFDVVRSPWCRSLSADALKLGRPVYAKVVLGPDRPGAFMDLVRGVHQGDPTSNILAVFGTAAAGQALTMLVARDGTWQRDRPASASLIRSVPLDLAQLMPPDPAEWIVEVHLGLPSTIADPMPVIAHPLVTIIEAARVNNFRTLLVQYPNIPPRVSSLDYRWLRVRIGVPYRRSDSLNRLRKFLEVLREIRKSRYDMSVHILPEMATFEASETAPEDAVSAPVAADSAGLLRALDIEGRPATEAERQKMLPLVLCSDSASPVLSEVLLAVAKERPELRLAAVSSAQVHGMAVSFIVFRSAGDLAIPLGDLVRAKVPKSARIIPPIDDRFRIGQNSRIAIRRAPRDPASGPILWVRLRACDRIGLMDDLLTRLENMLIRQGERVGVSVADLDVWSSLFRVVDGRTLIGRAMIRLPESSVPGGWDAISWPKVAQRLFEDAAPEDVIVLQLELLRAGKRVAPQEKLAPEWSTPTGLWSGPSAEPA